MWKKGSSYSLVNYLNPVYLICTIVIKKGASFETELSLDGVPSFVLTEVFT